MLAKEIQVSLHRFRKQNKHKEERLPIMNKKWKCLIHLWGEKLRKEKITSKIWICLYLKTYQTFIYR